LAGFSGPPAQLADDATALADLLRGFAMLAWYGAFAGARPPRGTPGADRWTGRAHAFSVELRENELWAVLDLGSCPPQSMETLCAAIAGYCEERVPLAYVRIGGAAVREG
jgi:hypothetical protein